MADLEVVGADQAPLDDPNIFGNYVVAYSAAGARRGLHSTLLPHIACTRVIPPALHILSHLLPRSPRLALLRAPSSPRTSSSSYRLPPGCVGSAVLHTAASALRPTAAQAEGRAGRRPLPQRPGPPPVSDHAPVPEHPGPRPCCASSRSLNTSCPHRNTSCLHRA